MTDLWELKAAMNRSPVHCEQCKAYFEADRLLQREMIQTAVRYGPNMATADLNERLEEYHDGGHE